jgi:uncharacterized protein with von Willebrand factor type A (vWA) domain
VTADRALDDAPQAAGRLADNILYFARALREAGLPVGPGGVLDAIAAVTAAGIGDRADFYATLHAIFVKKHEHSLLFDQAFRIFWRRKGFLEKLIAELSPRADAARQQRQKAEAGASRIAEALFKTPQRDEKPEPSVDIDARFTVSAAEILQTKDFAQMSAAEIARARELIARLVLPDDSVKTRRHFASAHGRRVDPRRSFRRTLRNGGAIIDLAFRAPALRHPPIVALCDISGSMSEYTRIFLHFLHALGEQRRVTTFLFGTRLTNVTRALRARGRSRTGRAAPASARPCIASIANGRAARSGRGRSSSCSPTGSSATAPGIWPERWSGCASPAAG